MKDPVPIETVTHELVKALTPVTAQYSAPYQDVQQLDFPIGKQARYYYIYIHNCILHKHLCTVQHLHAYQPLLFSKEGCFNLFEYIFVCIFISEEISRLMDSLNWSVEGQFVDGNIWPVAIDDQNLSCSMIPPEAECSNRSSFPNSAMYKSDKGKSKMV